MSFVSTIPVHLTEEPVVMGIQCWNVGVMIDTIVFFDGVLVGDST